VALAEWEAIHSLYQPLLLLFSGQGLLGIGSTVRRLDHVRDVSERQPAFGNVRQAAIVCDATHECALGALATEAG
jgi:hypothetical protein